MTTAAPQALPRLGRARGRRRTAMAVAAALVLAAVAVGFPYRRQIVSYLTHLKGAPSHTVPYVPFPADDPPALRVAVVGDVGDSGRRIDATGQAIAALEGAHPFDVLLLLGDNVYPSGDPARLPDTVFEPFAAVLDEGARLLAIVGNHDRPRSDEQMEALGMPGRWWSEELGPVLLIGLDSNDTEDPAQLAWLEATLRASTATWKVVAVHHPPYSAGYQGSNDAVRERFVPIFERYGVRLVLSGHEHDYQRSVEMDGVTYVITGAASGTRRTGEADFTAASFSWHSYVELGFYPDRIVGRVMNQDNRVADEWIIRLAGP